MITNDNRVVRDVKGGKKMSKITANIFSEFEKSLLKNMQELEIMKNQKEYVKMNFGNTIP